MPRTLSAYRPSPRQRYIAEEGYPFIALALGGSLFAFAAAFPIGGALFALLGVAIALFFRNPDRSISEEPGVIVSPGDGRILSIEPCTNTPLTGKPSTKISIFLSIFNVHINRAPVQGSVKKIAYRAGKFFVASFDKASKKNEQNLIVIEDRGGRQIVFSQIAGLIARRIVCYLQEGMECARGERIGLIRFGSRVDLYLPPESKIEVNVADSVCGGSSILARLP